MSEETGRGLSPDLCANCDVGEHLTCDAAWRANGLCGCTSSRHKDGSDRMTPEADRQFRLAVREHLAAHPRRLPDCLVCSYLSAPARTQP